MNLPKSPPLIVDTTGYDDIRRIIETYARYLLLPYCELLIEVRIAVDQRLPSSGVIARDCFGTTSSMGPFAHLN